MNIKFHLKKLTVLIFLVGSFHKITAQVLTLDQAIKQGVDNNRQLKISSYKIALAETKYQEAVDLTLPSLKASAGYTKLSDVDQPKIQFPGAPEPVALFPVYVNNYSAKVSLSETVFSGFRLKYAMESQKLLQQATKLDAGKDHDEVVFNIINAYFNLYKLRQSIQIVDENLRSLDQRISEALKMEQQGILLHNDVLKLQLQHSNTELTRIDLQNNLAIASFNFNILIGNNEKASVNIDSTTVKDVESLKSMDEYVSDAMKNRSDLQALTTRSKSIDNNLKIAKNSYYPQLAVAANYYDARPNPRVIPPKDQFVTTWDAGLVLTWDLMNLYSNKHNIADSRIQMQQSEENIHMMEDAIKMEVNQNYLTCMQSKQRIEVMQSSLLQAEENYRIVNSRFNSSLALTSELVDADAALLQAKVNLTLAKSDACVNYYRLKKSIGSMQ
ncbi:MAG: TolC family protein [Bacteroidetes bacterium]|nr:TolC family protein [Bacteroidota bacterium]